MSLSDVTAGKLREGKENFVTNKEGLGSSVLTQVIMEERLGVRLNPILIDKNSEYKEGEPRLAIGLNNKFQGKEYGRIHISPTKNETLAERINNMLNGKMSEEWKTIAKILEGKENVNKLENVNGINLLDAYARCDTRQEKLELMRSLYSIKEYNPLKDSVPLDKIPQELRDKIENSNKKFYDAKINQELNHVKKIEISPGKTVDLIVSKHPRIGEALNNQNKNNVIINPVKKVITINTDGKTLNPHKVMTALGRIFGNKINDKIIVRGNQVIIETKSLKDSVLGREGIISILKGAVNENTSANSISTILKNYIEERFGSMTSWSHVINDLYVKTINAMEKQNFEINPNQVVKINGIGKLIGEIDKTTGKVELEFKLTDEFKIGNRNFEAYEYNGVKFLTTYKENEIPNSLKQIIDSMPDMVKEKIGEIVLIRPEESNNKRIQERIENLKNAINNGEIKEKIIFWDMSNPEGTLNDLLKEMKNIISETIPVEKVFTEKELTDSKINNAIKDFKTGISNAFQEYYLNKVTNETNANTLISPVVKNFIDNTLGEKLNDIFVIASNMNLNENQQARLDYIVSRIEEAKQIDFNKEENSFGDLESFCRLFDTALKDLNQEIKDFLEELKN